MTKKLKWLAACAGILVLLAALAPWTFSGPAMRQQLARQIRKTTGLVAEAHGRTTFALLPRPRIKIEDVSIRDRDGKLAISAGTLRGDLRILPAFAGRMEVASLSLAAPSIDVDLEGKLLTSEGAIARASEARPDTSEAADADQARLASLTIQSGTVHLKRGALEVALLRDVDLALEWSSLSKPAGLHATFAWSDEPVDVTAWISRPAEVLRGETSPMSLKLTSPSLDIAANGIVSGASSLAYSGKLTVSSPSLRHVSERNGLYLPLPGPLGELALSAEARASMRSLQLSDLHFTLDGNAFEGALILSSNQGRPALMGTLATNLLNLDPLLAEVPSAATADRQWNRDPLPKPDFGRTDVDLRVSATRVQIGRVQLRDAGLALLVAGGTAEVAVAEAKAFGGTVKARLSADPSPTGYNMRATAAFARVESANLLNDLFRNQRVAGAATGEFALAGEGSSIAQVLRSLRGTASIDLANGDIAGLDLEQALRRLEKRPLSIASEIRSGRTTFDKAHLDLEVANGQANIRELTGQGPGVDFTITGQASIASRLLDLSIRARQSGRDTPQDGPQISLDLRGNWDEPSLLIDADSLIRHSQAAAPLLRALAPPQAEAEPPAATPQPTMPQP